MYLHDGFLSGIACNLPQFPDESVYETWPESLHDALWQQIRAVYADSVQLNILRALAIAGVDNSSWLPVFSQLIAEEEEWRFIKQSWFEHGHIPDLDWFVRAVVGAVPICPWRLQRNLCLRRSTYRLNPLEYYCCLPPVYPVWMLAYGYTQRHYLQDLGRYWSALDSMYYQPWPGTLIGDLSSLTALKQIGVQARQEIGALLDLVTEQVQYSEVDSDRER